MIINPKYEIGQIVYLKTDLDQLPRIVFGYIIYRSVEIIYKIAHGTNNSEHYEFELSDEKDVLLKLTN
jgi:hypothetical protein